MSWPPDIVFLVLDSLRADYCSCLGEAQTTTPVIDRLAENGCLYTEAYSTASWTVPATASIFTGKLPSEIGVHLNDERFDVPETQTLAGRLGANGYRTLGVSANPWLTAEFGFDTGFDELERLRPELRFPEAGDPRETEFQSEGVQRKRDVLSWVFSGNPVKRAVNFVHDRYGHVYSEASTVNERLVRKLERTPANSPTFLFANYMDVHEPYRANARTRIGGIDGTLDVNWNLHSLIEPPNEDSEDICDAYADAASYLDSQVGALFDRLRQKDFLSEAFLVVLSDHGQGLGEHGFWGHGTFLYDGLLRVPLIVRPPASMEDVPSSVDTPVSIRWVFDLLLDVVTAEDPDEVAFSPSPESQRPVVAESHGPAQDVDVSLPDDQSLRSRVFVFDDGRVTHLYDPDRYDIWLQESDCEEPTDETLLTKTKRIESRLGRLRATSSERRYESFENETMEQLEDLGYL